MPDAKSLLILLAFCVLILAVSAWWYTVGPGGRIKDDERQDRRYRERGGA